MIRAHKHSQTYAILCRKGMIALVSMSTLTARCFRLLIRRFGAVALLATLCDVSGCGSNTSVSNVQVGSITFTDINGDAQKTAPTSLTAGQGSYVDVSLTGDPQLLGANWSVYCGSALAPGAPLPPGQTEDESCGSFVPTHTMSGPVPSYLTSASGYVALYTAPASTPKNGTVTLFASSVSNPSKYSSVTLTIGGLAISVGLAPAPPTSMKAGADAQVRAVLNNDTSNAGVSWNVLCGSSNCGSFNPATTTSGEATSYTSPSMVPPGGSVQVTATSIADPTKAVSATISIQQ